uniref:Uncharacterized protein n=1 Tax=Rhizophora mucronata TaxID=61149 RepID=A0A2P2Q6H8_RHIMU
MFYMSKYMQIASPLRISIIVEGPRKFCMQSPQTLYCKISWHVFIVKFLIVYQPKQSYP